MAGKAWGGERRGGDVGDWGVKAARRDANSRQWEMLWSLNGWPVSALQVPLAPQLQVCLVPAKPL